MRDSTNSTTKRPAFTLVELMVVIVVLGLLAALGIPRFMRSVERSKASEAFTYLSTVRAAQERYHARHGSYAGSLDTLDLNAPRLRYFSAGELQPGLTGSLRDSWVLTLTRHGPSSGYGSYTVTFTEDGYTAVGSSIAKYAAINPMEP